LCDAPGFATQQFEHPSIGRSLLILLLTLVLFAAIAVFVVLDHRRRAKDEF
jgi:hypothetical protein